MASQSDVVSDTSSSSIFSTLLQRNRDLSLLLPFIIGFSAATNSDDPPQESSNSDDPRRQRVILINPFSQGVVLIDAGAGDALFREMGAITKSGRPSATKESIAGLEIVKIGVEEEEEKGECVICLEEWEIGGVAKKMPCNHKFHGDCIEKWLGIHGCCPVCRYEMPKQDGKKEDDNDDDDRGERRRVISNRDVWVSFSFTSGSHQNQHSSRDSNDSSSTPSSDREEQS